MFHSELLEISNISPRSISAKRNKYMVKTVQKNKKDEYLKDKWEIVPVKLKKSIRVRKRKPHNIAFEERVWALFAKMLFKYINADNKFKLEYGEGLNKQIDVFAADDEAILIVECKSSKERGRGNYQKDINELIGIKDKLRISAQKLFPGKQKVALLFLTNNSMMGENDKKRLETGSIIHLNQDDIDYFEQLTDHLGRGAKYQFFGKLFADQKIPELQIRVPAIKGKVSSGHTFYSFSIDPEYLLKVCFILHRTETNPDAVNSYQRLVKKQRLKQIGEYIKKGGYFPNSVIINIITKKGKPLKYQLASHIDHDSSTKMGVLQLPQCYKSAFIIDGQHRVYGYSVTKSKSNHTIPVVAFENLPLEEQSKIFVDINHTQKSVPANLLHSIMADFNWNSANDKMAISALKTRLFTELNRDESSPFYKRIILSEEKKDDLRCLTLQTIKTWGFNKVNFFGQLKGDKIVKTGYLADVDYGKTLKKSLEFFNTSFRKIEEELSEQWNIGSGEGGFIAMNIGVSAMIRILDGILDFLVKSENLKPEIFDGKSLALQTYNHLDPIIEFIKGLDYVGLKKMRSLFGSGATEKVLREFQSAIHKEFSDFTPEGLEQWEKESTGEFTHKAYLLGFQKIEPIIDNYIKAKLIEELGKKNWWYEGVPASVRTACVTRKEQKKSHSEPWKFLDTIDYKEIIELHWELLGESFTPPSIGNVSKRKKIGWIVDFNFIRQKYSHPQREPVTEEEFLFLESTIEWLEKSLIIK